MPQLDRALAGMLAVFAWFERPVLPRTQAGSLPPTGWTSNGPGPNLEGGTSWGQVSLATAEGSYVLST